MYFNRHNGPKKSYERKISTLQLKNPVVLSIYCLSITVVFLHMRVEAALPRRLVGAELAAVHLAGVLAQVCLQVGGDVGLVGAVRASVITIK